MTIAAVEDAIQHVNRVVSEWREAGQGLDSWREDHTRYATIDPIIRALGWNTADPKECHPEYPRPYHNRRRVDYALFGEWDVEYIASGTIQPVIIIESKALDVDFTDHEVQQLRGYVGATPRMEEGVAVLTNGKLWWLYDVSKAGRFDGKLICKIDIVEGNRHESARLLNDWLSRSQWR